MQRDCLLMFRGGRSHDGELQPFKEGALPCYSRRGSIVPIAISRGTAGTVALGLRRCSMPEGRLKYKS